MFKITWLGQAGLLFESEELTLIIDPYLSNSVQNINPNNYRRVAVCSKFLDYKPDVVICTHSHLDHTDPDTLHHFLSKDYSVCTLSPKSAWSVMREFGGRHNHVQFNRHSEWTVKGTRFTAVRAEHSDQHSIGVLIDDGEKKYYITGDTLYNTEIFEDIPSDIYALFLPINGAGNNMNMIDAARFAQRVGASVVVPMHWGMFDEINPQEFDCKNKVIPNIYEEIVI